MVTIEFSTVPPTNAQMRDMVNPGVGISVGAVVNPATFQVVLTNETPDDVAQLIAGHRERGWYGTVL